ncbi:hypothetical protein [uncultured Metabacillus sp.]|uniref:hypothetical protein n=1 Tax=uncultured Metabacillus sp. TaxID=2860135 RepID=UPI0026169119|nr:hypothetical protein [uncultured Metabacillus sp.]
MGRVKRYVPKGFIFDAEEVKENGEAVSQYGIMPIFAGEIKLVDLYKNELPETKELFESKYIQVEIEEDKLEIDKEDMAAMYASYGSWMTNNEEDENYIKGTKDIHSIE